MVTCEPGDQLAKDAAILLGEVVTVERRRGVTFVGLDLGWNVNCSYFIYRFAQEFVVCRAADAPRTQIVTVAAPHGDGLDALPPTDGRIIVPRPLTRVVRLGLIRAGPSP